MPIAERVGGAVAAAAGAACAHCGLPVPRGRLEPGAAEQFCCEGCRAVREVLAENGLERYYAIRDGLAGTPGPARPTRRGYEELDEPGLLARTCHAGPGGLLATELYLEGVHCAACVWLVERLPALVPGVTEARLDLPRATVRVSWEPGAVTLSAVARGLDRLGFPPHPCRGAAARDAARREDRRLLARIGLAGAVAANVMAIAFALYAGMLDGMEGDLRAFLRGASLLLTLPAFVWGGGVFFGGAWRALRAGVLHMDVPIAVGLLAGMVHGTANALRDAGEVYFDTIAVLIFLLLAGRYLQRRQQRAAADATELLASLAPAFAHLVEDGRPRDVPIETLGVGARVEVRAGELVPADGVVSGGRSSLDRALLTGESRPAPVAPGDRVEAGTVNLAAPLVVRVERTGEDTRAGRLMALVAAHAARRAPIVQLADRVAIWFTGAVLLLAGATAAIWWPRDPEAAVAHAVALLIVTCPCALALATPLALGAAVGRAARGGLLIKGGDVIERLARPGRLWLDKTGTLTAGRLAVIRWAGDPDARALAAAAESGSAHPVARALAAGAGAGLPVVDVVETQGAGVAARVAGRRVVVGSPAHVTAAAGPAPAALRAAVDAMVAEALTPVLVAVDGRVAAAAGLGDPLRPDAAAAVAAARARGWRVGILSGDHPAVVAATARRLGLDPGDCRGGVTPEGKLAAVLEGRRRGPVMMVGDGVNDAAALAAATVGVGVHGGAEATLEAADVFVTRPGIAPLVELLDGARRAMAVVRRNLVFALAYNAVGIALAMTGRLDPLVAAVLMPLSSITVVTSSYRARTFAGKAAPR